MSVRAYVVGLILVVVVPLLLFGGFMVLRSAEHEQEILASVVREHTEAAAAAIDDELSVWRSRLFILGASNNLQTGDLAAFAEQAMAFAKQTGLMVVLSDPVGQELVDTLAPPDAQLPMMTDPEAVRRVVGSGLPDVSGYSKGPMLHEPVIAISVPVRRRDQVVYVLSLNIAPAMADALAQLKLPPDWIVTIADGQGVTVARSREADRFVGQMGRSAIIERFRAAGTGWLPLVSREGVPVYTAFAHVKLAGWVVAVGIPDAVLFAPVHRSTTLLILAGVATLAVALLAAIAIGRRIARSIVELMEYADAVGRGERIEPRATGIEETDAVARSLHQASKQLQQSAQERSELLHRTLTAQESERKRIARELHDSLGQYLTALRLGFNTIDAFGEANQVVRERLAELKNLASDIGRELNRIAWELRPMALDDLGLRRSVFQYVEEWAERSRLHIDIEITLDDRRLPQTVETTLFRVLQEAITNVVKHAGADRVAVILEARDDVVRLIVEDNGKGCPQDADAELTLGMKHLGLLGVRERLASVNGNLEVESSVNGGTTVYVSIPL